jgi:hypothetical protein
MAEDLKLARKYFELKEYDQSRILFESVEVNTPLSIDDARRLARAYALVGDKEEAIYRGQSILSHANYENQDILFLADLLKADARYAEAKKYLELYAKRGGERARDMIASVEFAQSVLEYEKNCDLENLAYNTSSAESGVTFYNGDLVYASHRVELDSRFGIKGGLDKRPTSVLYAVDAEEVETNTTPIKVQSGDADNFGFAAYSGNGMMMVFVKSDFEVDSRGVSQLRGDMGLFYSQLNEQGEWKADQPFPYNSDEYDNGFPYLSQDGQTLFYASNMKDGFGGFDIYVSHFEDGGWTAPRNLGPDVNTPGNEITPYISDSRLYFASDYLPGLGGYDVFSIKNVDNRWEGLEHMGACVNSPGDDYGFIKDPGGTSAYFTSTREGGKGHDDIYRVGDVNALNRIEIMKPEMTPMPVMASADIEKDFQSKGTAEDEMTLPVLVNTVLDAELEELDVEEEEVLENENTEEVISEEVSAENEVLDTESIVEAAEEEEVLDNENAEGVVIYTSLWENMTETDHEAIGTEYTEKIVEEDLSDYDLTGILMYDDASIRDKELGRYEKVYFIQIAALSRYTDNLERFHHFRRFGNVYKIKVGGITKIRIGYFKSQSDAIEVLKVLKSKGIREAFIVGDVLDANKLELVVARSWESEDDRVSELVSSYKSKYKVRVAAYRSPGRFQTSQVSDLGHIEHWTKGEWKIIVLSGYNSLDQAKSTLRKVQSRGFRDAFIVEDIEGALERVR